MNWLHLLYAVIAFLVGRVLYDFYTQWVYQLKSKSHGCVPPRMIWNLPFGIPRAIASIKAVRNFQVLEEATRLLDSRDTTTVRVQNLGDFMFLTKDPEIIKAILATQFKEFDLGKRHQAMAPFLGDGIFTLSGNGWSHSRSLLRPQFKQEDVSRIGDLEHSVKNLLDIFRKQSSNNKPFEAQEYFFKLTLDTATEYLFGESTESLLGGRDAKSDEQVSAAEFTECFNRGQEMVTLRFIFQDLRALVTTPDFKRVSTKCKQFVDYYVNEVLEEKRENKGSLTEAGRYYFLRELAQNTDDPVIMRDQSLNILLAGRDTTAALLSFTMSMLARHKDVWNKLREAVLTDFGTTTEDISFHSLKRCDYLKYVINEVLRLYPIVPMNARFAVKDTTISSGGGRDGKQPLFVPKGAPIGYNTYALHRDKNIWGPDAEDFKPERWATFRPPSWTYIPFNGGPRICLGQQLALTEASYVIVRILQTFKDIHMDPQELATPVILKRALTLSVGKGLHIYFTEA